MINEPFMIVWPTLPTHIGFAFRAFDTAIDQFLAERTLFLILKAVPNQGHIGSHLERKGVGSGMTLVARIAERQITNQAVEVFGLVWNSCSVILAGREYLFQGG